jgi:hypothetical protein
VGKCEVVRSGWPGPGVRADGLRQAPLWAQDPKRTDRSVQRPPAPRGPSHRERPWEQPTHPRRRCRPSSNWPTAGPRSHRGRWRERARARAGPRSAGRSVRGQSVRDCGSQRREARVACQSRNCATPSAPPGDDLCPRADYSAHKAARHERRPARR